MGPERVRSITGYVRAHPRPYWKPFVGSTTFVPEGTGVRVRCKACACPRAIFTLNITPVCPSGRRKCSPKFWRAFPGYESQNPSLPGRRKRSPNFWRARPVKNGNHKLRSKPSENARKNRASIFLGPETRMQRTKSQQIWPEEGTHRTGRELTCQIDI